MFDDFYQEIKVLHFKTTRSNKEHLMVRVILLVLLVLVQSCAHHQTHEIVANFPYQEDLLKEVISSNKIRRPASTQSEKSNRRIYFSTLYHQYKTLARAVKTKEDLDSCPQFHHDKINVDSHPLEQIEWFTKFQNEKEDQLFFPEAVFQNQTAVVNYFESIKNEVKELCENGYSDNFYKFDNLVVYHTGKNDFHQKVSSMKAVLKIPIFANFYLLKMMTNPFERSKENSELNSFIERSNTFWFQQYVLLAQKKRQELPRLVEGIR